MSGYRDCACRDCFEIAIGELGAMCHACEEAGCEGGDHECDATEACEDDACEYWHELRWQDADRGFDGGEFSSALQGEPRNQPCGQCDTCTESAKTDVGPA